MAAVGTKLSTILVAIRDKLVSDSVFPSNRCRISLRMNVPHHNQADQYAVILPLAQNYDQQAHAGHGRRGAIVEGRINVYVRQRMALDDWYGDESWLASSTGFLDKLNAVEDSLDHYNPSSAGVALLCEPMRAFFANEPRKDYDAPEWGEGMIELEIKYRAYRTGL